MKKILICLLTILLINKVDAQSNLNPENAKVLSVNSSIEQIYLKKGSNKISLKNDSIIFQRDYYNFNTKETYTFEKRLKNDGIIIALNQLQNLAKGQQVIDRAPIYIETYFKDNTKEKQMIYSNEMIEDLFGHLSSKYKIDMNDYVNQLPSGKYGYPMFINRRVEDNKSDFYKVIEKDLIAKGMIDKDIFNQPNISINKVQSTFEDLNQLDSKRVESYQILSGKEAVAKYGSSSKNGLILITLVD